jgi:hypothetical protein
MLKDRMNAKMGDDIPKIDKLDWHNWWNESKQMTTMLNTVAGFNVYQDDLIMKAGNAAAAAFIPRRSQTVRQSALIWHDENQIADWQLHHIMPIEYATGSADLELLDSKENLLYIPASVHKRIPRTSNLMVKLSYDSSNVNLSNPLGPSGDPKMSLSWPRDVRVKFENLEKMVEYNFKLLGLVISD